MASSQRARAWSALVDVALLLLVVAIPAAAIQALPTATAPAAKPLPDLQLIINACSPVDEEFKMECVLASLYPLLDTHGVAPAFAALQELANRSVWILKKDHPLAHSLGREAYIRLGNAPDVLAECPYGMASGCFHGVLEAYLAGQSGNLTPEQVAGICKQVDEVRGPFGYFQCLHGLGHGLTMFLDHDLMAALSHCDYLPDWWTRESCYGGAFMENIVSFQVWSGLGVGEGILHNHDDEEGETHHGWIYASNPWYPCADVEEKYKGACYNIHTTAFLTLNGYDVENAFRLCDQVEANWIHMCYLSMGRDISSIANRDAYGSNAQCWRGNATWREWCIVGVVKDFINSAGYSSPGFAFCKIVDAADKPLCYKAIGEILVTMIPDKGQRWTECGLSEADYIDDCRNGAWI